MMEADLNISDPTHNRGKVKRINSFTTTQEQVETVKRQSNEDQSKVLMLGGKHSLVPAPKRTHVGSVRYTSCGGTDHLRKDCHEDFFCKRCRTRSHTQKCAVYPTKQVGAAPFAFIVVVSTHFNRCHNRPNDNWEEPRSTPRDLRECGPGKAYNKFMQQQVNHHQTRFDEGLNRQYLPTYNNYHQSPLGSIPVRI